MLALILSIAASGPPPQVVLSSASVSPDNAIAEVIDFSGDAVITGTGNLRFQLPVDGAVRLFERTGGVWVQTYQADGANSELLGHSVALDGDFAAYSVGLGTSTLSDDRVVVLRKSQGVWLVDTVLAEPSSIAESSQYGRSIAISGSRIAISAHRRIGTNPYVPQAYVYDRTPAGWTLTERLRPGPDPVTGFVPRAGAAATPVALDGDRLALGAGSTTVNGADYAGRVYMFELGPGGWGSPSFVEPEPPRAGVAFGAGGLAFAGADLAVGELRGLAGTFSAGTVEIFSPAGQGWTHTATLARPVASETQRFGWTLDASADHIAVGADRLVNYSGSIPDEPVEVYARGVGGSWAHVQSITDPYFKFYSHFGNAVAVSGTEVAIGASRAWAHSDERGAAYVQPLATPLPTVTQVVCPGTACPCPAPTDPNFNWMGCFSRRDGPGALSGSGSTSLALDRFELVGEFMPPNVMFMTAAAPIQPGSPGGTPRAYGSGTLCVESPLLLPPRMTRFDGLLVQPPGIAGDMATLFGAAGTILVGESWLFQAIYRDAKVRRTCNGNPPSLSDLAPATTIGRFNVTNGVAVTFQP